MANEIREKMKIRAFGRYWIGTDALTLVKLPPGKFIWRFRIWGRRLFWRLCWPYFEHFAYSETMICPIVLNLIEFGIPRERIHLHPGPLTYQQIKKQRHDGFNVLFYASMGDGTNNRFKRWKYGVDIFEQVKAHYEKDNIGWNGHNINFIYVDGSQDLTRILPIVDVYIRPSRHDGAARLVRECERNNIPVFWSNRENVTAEEVIGFIEKCKNYLKTGRI